MFMKMTANGEINEKDLETTAVQDKLHNLFKEKLKIVKYKIFIMRLSMLCNNDIVVAKHIFFYQVCWIVIDRSC